MPNCFAPKSDGVLFELLRRLQLMELSVQTLQVRPSSTNPQEQHEKSFNAALARHASGASSAAGAHPSGSLAVAASLDSSVRVFDVDSNDSSTPSTATRAKAATRGTGTPPRANKIVKRKLAQARCST
ncbi:hypothetical protein ACMD2_21244 [Ananas comosus]|uniref:Uncharacterized protein n=1 Tax=Ananas comosus TaxID=4615 RepID=A0A199VL56_ANACO|nr:hypothetical protein ACMD2_21244 [Ananas comosus]